MSLDQDNDRERLNELMADHDEFFSSFGALDESVYADGAIPKLYKELTGLSISVVTSCDECVTYNIEGALDAGADREQLIEAIKIGVIGRGSVTYPTARFAFSVLEEHDIL
ncbi:carboxymuconolactone decarboxylase family protein [Halorubrum tropicale]|uniref:Cytochrome D ubiquinol oxidase subunit II n=1 Tax=Halorubrum tropicale TaxID=1765655 RepID=A0A0M9AN91_9EURY|nr:carboxymuconolactone decarboxylase family protein [Halorubrum tropicale]KOX95497.1 cytochrome D ubiquinol oxidase subunit II [Halorubrum tropicale]